MAAATRCVYQIIHRRARTSAPRSRVAPTGFAASTQGTTTLAGADSFDVHLTIARPEGAAAPLSAWAAPQRRLERPADRHRGGGAAPPPTGSRQRAGPVHA